MNLDFLNGSGGDQSSKRVFTLVLLLLWVIYFFANLFWGYQLKETIETNLFYMVLAFYTGVAIEKLLPSVYKGSTKTESIKETIEVKKTE